MATKTKVFVSPLHDLKIIVRNREPERRDAYNRVIADTIPGKYVQFREGRFETDDKETVEFLREHVLFETPRGFWEEGNAPDEPKPTAKDQRKAINKATADGDLAALRELRDEEREGHNRANLIEEIEDAIANIAVPEAEEAQKVVRADEPAESEDAVPRVDPAEPPKLEPESEREKVIKSETVAEARGEAVAEGGSEDPPEPPPLPVEEQIEREREAETAEETEKAAEGAKPKKPAAKKRAAKKKPAARQANTGQRTTASAEAGAAKSNAKDSGGADSGKPS